MALLGEIESASLQHPLRQAIANLLALPNPDTRDFLAKVQARVLTLSDSSVHRLSQEIVTSIDVLDSSSSFIDAINSALIDESLWMQSPRLDEAVDKTNGVRLRGAYLELAFDWPYKGQALDAFIEYLDIQWVLMQKRTIQGVSLQSRCGTIVQSSCAGKSRLMKEYPSFNLDRR